MRSLTVAALAVLAVSFAPSSGACAEPASPGSIPSVLAAADSFDRLLHAVKAAGLAEALEGEGPFTLFAPTDDAFDRALRGDPGLLRGPGGVERLRSLLTFHVVAGKVDAAELLSKKSLRSLDGRTLSVTYRDGRIRVGGAVVSKAGIPCANGVVHVLESVLAPAAAPKTVDVRRLLTFAIARGVPLYNSGHPDACAAVYEVAALGALPAVDARDREKLEAAIDRAAKAHDKSERAWILRRAFDRILMRKERMTMPVAETKPEFEVTIEAELPEGFPAPGPVGRVVEKEYPRYRMARVEGGMAAFWTLFGHIKKKDIAMTAPVEMTLDDEMGRKDMAFLYASTKLGEIGRDGRVVVADLDPIRVLSIGVTGPLTREKMQSARRSIESRLAADGRLEAAGELRLLGYNSPMVPAKKRFYEVQMPVRERAAR